MLALCWVKGSVFHRFFCPALGPSPPKRTVPAPLEVSRSQTLDHETDSASLGFSDEERSWKIMAFFAMRPGPPLDVRFRFCIVFIIADDVGLGCLSFEGWIYSVNFGVVCSFFGVCSQHRQRTGI